MVTAWWIWKWRNNEVFKGESYEYSQKMKWLTRQKEEIKEAFAKMRDPGAAQWRNQRLKWDKPDTGWMRKLGKQQSWVCGGCEG